MIKVLIIILYAQYLFSATYLVPEQYSTIMAAIAAANYEGDTVLVAEGRYMENLHYMDNNVYVTSYFPFTQNDSTIINTIIDGNQNGSVVVFDSGELGRDAVLNGFTITNGSGTVIGSGRLGGGIFIKNSDPSILNCKITGNSVNGYTGAGGGMSIMDSEAYLAGSTISGNFSIYNCGGLFLHDSNIEMDSLNRCNIYLNNAGEYNDIHTSYDEIYPDIYLDTASVDYLDDYFIAGNLGHVDILNSKLERINNDLFVSPDGDNNNSGLTANAPLKNITYALHLIEADSLNPHIIHLLPGIYSPSGGQIFPLNLRSYVSLIGSGQETTILDLESVIHQAMHGRNYEKNIVLSNMTVKNVLIPTEYSDYSHYPLDFLQNDNLLIENMIFENFSKASISTGRITSEQGVIENTKVTLRNCEFINSSASNYVKLSLTEEIIVKNCRFDNIFPYPFGISSHHYATALRIGGYNGPYNNEFSARIEYSIFTNNVNNSQGSNPNGAAITVLYANGPVDIVNCTFADNSSINTGTLHVKTGDYSNQGEVRIINCLFWNEENEIVFNAASYPSDVLSRLIMAHNNIENSILGVIVMGEIEFIWEDSNIDAYPLFTDNDNGDYSLQENSPCIDAGTSLYIFEGDTIVNLSPVQYYGDAPDIGAIEYYPAMSVSEKSINLPTNIKINSIYPNPFNSSTTIQYQLSESGSINLSVYDLNGRLIKQLITGVASLGEYKVTYNFDELATGHYLLKLTTNSGIDVQHITFLK